MLRILFSCSCAYKCLCVVRMYTRGVWCVYVLVRVSVYMCVSVCACMRVYIFLDSMFVFVILSRCVSVLVME